MKTSNEKIQNNNKKERTANNRSAAGGGLGRETFTRSIRGVGKKYWGMLATAIRCAIANHAGLRILRRSGSFSHRFTKAMPGRKYEGAFVRHFQKLVFKPVAVITLITFLSQQVLWANPVLVNDGARTYTEHQKEFNPEMPAESTAKISVPLTSDDFLQDTLTLEPVVNKISQEMDQARAYDRYDFEEALDLLDEDYAAAVILKDITAEDVKKLSRLGFETAVIVLRGEIVLFSTGNKEEIGILNPARALLEEAAFISHTHVAENAQEGPSSYDFQNAVGSNEEEYVITQKGVYAYNQGGLLNDGIPLSVEDYVTRLKLAAANDQYNQIEARAELNEFIRQMDLYNQAAPEEKEIFRASSQIITDDFNSLPLVTQWQSEQGNWYINSNQELTMGSSSKGYVTLAASLESNDYEISVDTKIGGALTQHGILLRFQDLNNFYSVSFDKWGRLRLYKNVAGVSTMLREYKISGVTSGWYNLRVRLEGNRFDISVNGVLQPPGTTAAFYEDTNQPFTGGKVGLYMDYKYEYFDNFSFQTIGDTPPPQPVNAPVVNALPALTNQTQLAISGTKDAGSSVWINGVEAVPANALTSWSYSLGVTLEGLNTFSVTSKNSTGAESTSVSISTTRDTVAPAIIFNSAVIVNQSNYVLSYTVDGVLTTENRTLTEGDNVLSVTVVDGAGNSTTEILVVELDSTPPEIIITGTIPSLTNNAALTVNYTSDGVIKQKTFNLTEGSNAGLTIIESDAAGNTSVFNLPGVTLDTVTPSGTISINNGDAETSSTNVNVAMNVADSESGLKEYRVSTDGFTWSNWTTYAANFPAQIAGSEGIQTVSVEIRDHAGNTELFSDGILFTPTPVAYEGPVINLINLTNLTASGATVSWTTDRESDARVEYRAAGSTAWQQTPLDANLNMNHSVTLTGLTAGADYEYRVISRDSLEKEVTSPILTFTLPTDLAPAPGFIGGWNFDDISGTQAVDFSGNNNTGTLVNGVVVSTDYPNTGNLNTNSLSFDGVNDHISIPNSADLNFGSGDFTLALWIRPDTVTVKKQAILDKSDGTNGYRLITSDVDGDRLKFIRGSLFGDGIQSYDGALKAGVWQHVAVVVSNGQVSFYVNGAYQGGGTLKTKLASTSSNLFIGQKGYSGSTVNNFDGSMDEVRVYNYALPLTDIQNLSTTVTPDTAPPVIEITSTVPSLTDAATLTVDYTVDGTAKQKIFNLNEGINTGLMIDEVDPSLNRTVLFLPEIRYELPVPKIVVTTAIPEVYDSETLTVDYSFNGTVRQKTFTLKNGDNILRIEEELDGKVYSESFWITYVDENAGDPTAGDAEQTFSLKTANDEVVEYLNNQILSIQKDRSFNLSQITFDQDGGFSSGVLRFLADDSLQIFEGGALVGYKRADGSRVIYSQGFIEKVIAPDGSETRYTYIKDEAGNILEIRLTNASHETVYDGNGRILKSKALAAGTISEYTDGILSRILDQNGIIREFVTVTESSGDRRVIPQTPGDETGFSEWLYNADGLLKSIKMTAGQTYYFDEEGMLSRVTDENGIELTYLSASRNMLSEVTGIQLTQGGVNAQYDAGGRLSRVSTEGFTLDYDSGSGQILSIVDTEGTKFSNLSFDPEGQLQTALIESADGVQRTYENGRLSQVIQDDDTIIDYIWDEIEEVLRVESVTLPGSITYHFDYQVPDIVVARLDPAIIPAIDTVKEIEFDAGLNLKRIIRQNNEIINYLDGGLIGRIDSPVEGEQIFEYAADGSYVVRSSSREAYYDARGQSERMILFPTEESPHTLDVRYRYGKIREVYKNNEASPVLTYSYEFKADGTEITVIEDLEEGARKEYEEGFLLRSLNRETGILSAYQYENGQVSEVVLTRLGKPIQTYTYTYNGGLTTVTDGQSVKRIYGSADILNEAGAVLETNQGKLLSVEKKGEIYRYAYFKNSAGEEIVDEKLAERLLTDGSHAYYEAGQVTRVERLDGTIITEVILDEDRNIESALITLTDGTRRIFKEGEILEEIRTDGTHYYFQNNRVARIEMPGEETLEYDYEQDLSGVVTGVRVRQGESEYVYGADEALEMLRLQGIENYLSSFESTADSSNYAHSISLGAGAALTTQAAVGTASIYFDGADDYLRIPDNQAFDLSGRVWTMDFWIRVPSVNGWHTVYRHETAPGHFMEVAVLNQWQIFMQYENYTGIGGSPTRYPVSQASHDNTLKPDTWQHVAIVQDGDFHRIYIDGIDQTVVENWEYYGNQMIGNQTSPVQLGGVSGMFTANDPNRRNFNGWLDEFRISKGVVRWTEDFTPPSEPAVSDSYTSLLLHFDGIDRAHYKFNRVTDTSGNTSGYTFAGKGGQISYDANGNAVSAGLSPEILSGSGLAAEKKFYDASTSGFYVKPAGDVAIQSTDSFFGNGAGIFDGAGDYLTLADSGSWNFRATDFTIDARIKFDQLPAAGQTAAIYYQQTDTNNYFMFGLKNTGSGYSYAIHLKSFGEYKILWESSEFTAGLQVGEWHHVALVKSKVEQYRIFEDGVLVGFMKNSSAIPNFSGELFIGADASGSRLFRGRMDELRVSKSARWTDNFTPDSISYTSDAGTSLLLHFDNEDEKAAQIFNQAAGRLNGRLSQFLFLPHRDSIRNDFFAESFEASVIGDWFSVTRDAVLQADKIVGQEYSASGVMETRTKASGTVTLFEDNRPSLVVDAAGKTIVEYYYDAQGDIERVYLRNARDILPDKVAETRARIEEQRQLALLTLAEHKLLATAEIKSQVEPVRAQLAAHISQIQSQLSSVEGLSVKGKNAKRQKAEAIDQLRSALANAWGRWEDLHRQEADAYARLDADVQAASDQIESETAEALTQLADDEADFKSQILLHEISPVIYDLYRKILGRDPTKNEYADWLQKVSYESGEPLAESSIYFDGLGDALEVTASDAINLAAEPWTIDFWFMAEGLESGSILWQSEGGEISLTLLSDGRLTLAAGGTTVMTTEAVVFSDEWTHAAVVREGNGLKLYIKGEEKAVLFSVGAIPSLLNGLLIGQSFRGHIDEFRVSNAARWQSSFVASPAYSIADDATALLIRQRMLGGAPFVDVSKYRHVIQTTGNPAVSVGQSIVDDPARLLTEVKTLDGRTLRSALKDDLMNSDELTERSQYVAAIKADVRARLEQYLALPAAEQAAFYEALGLSAAEVIALDTVDLEKILGWLESRNLHFGQSAFLALEELLDQKNILYDRETLAADIIITDILAGIITPLDDGDLVLSMFALDLAAERFEVDLTGVRLSLEDLKQIYAANPEARVIAFVGTDHYVVVTGVTDNEIIYIDPSIGRDKQNEIFTVTHEEFLGNWNGITLLEESVLTAAIPEPNERVMSESETRLVRGSGFWDIFKSIVNIIASVFAFVPLLQPIALGLFALTATISAIQGDIRGVITSAIGFVTAGMAGGFSALGEAFKGFTISLGGLGSLFSKGLGFFGTLFQPVTSVLQGISGGLGAVLGGLPGISSTIGAKIAEFAVGTGLSLGITKGLGALGLGSDLAGAIGTLAAGALMGGFGEISNAQKTAGLTRADILKNTMATVVLGNVGQLGQELNLSSGLTSVISLSIGAIQGRLISNPVNALESGFKGILKDIGSSLATHGLYELTGSLGLPAFASSLIALPFSAAVGSLVGNVFGSNDAVIGYRDDGTPIIVSNPKDLGDFIGDAIKTAPHEIRFNVGSIGGINEGGLPPIDIDGSVVNQPGLFTEIFNALKGAAISAVNFLGPVAFAATPALIENFNQKQITEGLSETLNSKITTIFDRQTIEEILKTPGGIDAILSRGTAPVTLPDGSTVNGYKFSDTTTLLFDESNNFVGQVKNSTTYEVGEFTINDNEFVLKTGESTKILGEGKTLTTKVANHEVTEVIYEELNIDGQVTSAFSIEGVEGQDTSIFIEGPKGDIQLGGTFKLKFGIYELEFQDNKLQSVDFKISESNQEAPAASDDALYVLVNGIGNDNEFGSPEYMRQLEHDLVTQSGGEVSARNDVIVAATFIPNGSFEKILKQLMGNSAAQSAIQKMKDAYDTFKQQTTGSTGLAWDVQSSIELFFAEPGRDDAERLRDMVGVGYSGGFIPMIDAILNGEYNDISFVALGAPTFEMGADVATYLVDIFEALESAVTLRDDATRSVFGNITNLLEIALKGIPGILATVASEFVQNLDIFYDSVHGDNLDATLTAIYDDFKARFAANLGYDWNKLANANAELFVNVYGSKDIFGGYIDQLGPYDAGTNINPIFNIEIVGANHTDYFDNFILRNFIAQITLNADNPDKLKAFLEGSVFASSEDLLSHDWVVTIPGLT